VLERREVPRLVAEALSHDELVATASDVLREQRSALEQADDPSWREHLERVLAEEKSLLHETFAHAVDVRRLLVPTRLPAGESVAAIATELAVGV
jgi:uncharacterized protein YoaH (UPF0181 family)